MAYYFKLYFVTVLATLLIRIDSKWTSKAQVPDLGVWEWLRHPHTPKCSNFSRLPILDIATIDQRKKHEEHLSTSVSG
jgi:hypothetical protein